MSEENAPVNLHADPHEIEALFVQTAGNMTYEDGYLTLYGLAPTTLMFSDRPDRVTGHLPTEEFVDSWGEGDDSFADNPPNAVLSIFTEDEVHDVVVVLQEPAVEGDEMRYAIDILDGEMPASGGANALFIDVIGRPMTPVSVAGARRRGRRRGRRRARRRTAAAMAY
jgi:hypothetical protein